MNKKIIIIAAVVVVVVAVAAGAVWFTRNNYPDNERLQDVAKLETILDAMASSSTSGVPTGNSYPQLITALQQSGTDLSSLSSFAQSDFQNLFYYNAPSNQLKNSDYVLAVKLSDTKNPVFQNAPTGYVDSVNCDAPNYCVESIVTVTARDRQRLSDLLLVQDELEMYFNQNSKYPTGVSSWSGLQSILVNANIGGVSTVPDDPQTGHHYYYATDASGTVYVVAALLENQADATGTFHGYSGNLPTNVMWETSAPPNQCGTGTTVCESL